MPREDFPCFKAAASGHISSHGTSSAFNSSEDPDEDWTKISDKAERRRIQNRIAQRNYRKKLKRRLEDLEKLTKSSPTAHDELQQQKHDVEKNFERHYRISPGILHQHPFPRVSQNPYVPPMDENLKCSQGSERDGSRIPPRVECHSYPAPEEIVCLPYPQSQLSSESQPYCSVSSSEYPDYLTPFPVALSSMVHFHEAIMLKDDTMSSFNMSYQGLPTMNGHGHHEYSHLQIAPPSHSHQHSTTCSESGSQHPTTPLSMPPSP